jgi:hypothetical protein
VDVSLIKLKLLISQKVLKRKSMITINFITNPNALQPLLSILKKTKIDEEVLNIVTGCITLMEYSEEFWADQLLANPRRKDIVNIYHASRILRCGMVGIFDSLTKPVDGNPTVLENVEPIIIKINDVWKLLAEITERYEHEKVMKLMEKIEEFEKQAKFYIDIGRGKDFVGFSPILLNNIKTIVQKITSEV